LCSVLLGVSLVLGYVYWCRRGRHLYRKRLYKKAVQIELERLGEKQVSIPQERVCTFYFVRADYIRTFEVSDERVSLPMFQKLHALDDALVPVKIEFFKAMRRGYDTGEYLVVSYRWFGKEQPDEDGEQLQAIRKYLDDHPEVKYVRFDYWCMPQGQRTPAEGAKFQWMLQNVNVLYVTMRVLILLDLSYVSRFWTQYEAWLSMQLVTPEGVQAAPGEHRRCTILPLYNVDADQVESLRKMWAGRTPQQAFEMLSKPDVTVTNQSDKEAQLPKILKFNDFVRETLCTVQHSSENICTVESSSV
jgi:hypothetical protein